MKLTQRQRIINRLREKGEVDNKSCILNGIWRLGAIICDLRKEGYEFETDYEEGSKNYVYKLIKSPPKTLWN